MTKRSRLPFRLLGFGALWLALAGLIAHPSRAEAADAPPQAQEFTRGEPQSEQLELPFESPGLVSLQHLKSALQETRAVILDSQASEAAKAGQIDRFFKVLENEALAHGDKALAALTEFNDQFRGLSRDEAARNLRAALPLDTGEKLSLQTADLISMARSFQTYLNQNPAATEFRISATVQALRALVGFEQEAFLRAVSSDPQQKSAGIAQIKRDLELFTRQIHALGVIGGVIQKYRSAGSPNGKNLTAEEMRPVVNAISDLGLVYIKFAQTISVASFLLPPEAMNALQAFQDNNEPLSAELVLQIMSRELGQDPRQIFIDFDPAKPLSCGSIACTYAAKVKTFWGGTRDVIIKVKRPGLEEEIAFNARFNRFILQAANVAMTPEIAPVLDFISDQIFGITEAFRGELDLKQEGRMINRFRRLFALSRNIEIPEVIEKYSTSDVLTMTKLDGANLSKVTADSYNRFLERKTQAPAAAQTATEPAATEKPLDPQSAQMARYFGSLLESTLYMTFVIGELHADMHPGNILARPYVEEMAALEKQPAKLGLIDFAQTVKTRGFITQPFRAGLFLAMGNSAGLAAQMVAMGKDPKFPAAKLAQEIEAIFQKYGIHRIYIKNVVRGKDRLPSVETTQKALGEIIKSAYTRLGYRASPRYIQIFRSFMPVGVSLAAMGRQLPFPVLIRECIWAFVRGVVLGYGKYLTLKYPNQLAEIGEILRDQFDELFHRTSSPPLVTPVVVPGAKRIPNCHTLFRGA